ncbi:MAG: hypothetical protein NVS9B8_09920 [Candidatus Limnocylindrales bacterium]
MGSAQLADDRLDRPVTPERGLVVVERRGRFAPEAGSGFLAEEHREDLDETDLERAEVPDEVLGGPRPERDRLPVGGLEPVDEGVDVALAVAQDVERVHGVTILASP